VQHHTFRGRHIQYPYIHIEDINPGNLIYTIDWSISRDRTVDLLFRGPKTVRQNEFVWSGGTNVSCLPFTSYCCHLDKSSALPHLHFCPQLKMRLPNTRSSIKACSAPRSTRIGYKGKCGDCGQVSPMIFVNGRV
jgi:hypothetical protein